MVLPIKKTGCVRWPKRCDRELILPGCISLVLSGNIKGISKRLADITIRSVATPIDGKARKKLKITAICRIKIMPANACVLAGDNVPHFDVIVHPAPEHDNAPQPATNPEYH